MSQPSLIHLFSLDDVRAAESAWDDLWWRSDVTIPTFRAKGLLHWIEQFAPNTTFHTLVVEHQSQWVAALPLIGRRVAKVIGAGTVPSNCWSSAGELLLDPAADVPAVLDLLAAGTCTLRWPLLWIDEVAIDARRWRALADAFKRAGVVARLRPQYSVARIETGNDWDAYRASLSRKHRQQMARCGRRLAEQGELFHRCLSELTDDQVEPWLRRGMEVEDRSWKGAAGTSVLKTAGMFDFFLRQARQLARWGQLEMHFLESAGQPVAFAYGMRAKGVYHSYRIGYDPRFAGYCPGQLLRTRMLEQFYSSGECRALDCLGPLTDAQQRWHPTTYTIGRMMAAPSGRLGRIALRAHQLLRPAPTIPVAKPAEGIVCGPAAEPIMQEV